MVSPAIGLGCPKARERRRLAAHVAPQGMVGGDLDQDDRHAVRVSKPQLDQPPGFLFRFAFDHYIAAPQFRRGRFDVADLQPQSAVEPLR